MATNYGKRWWLIAVMAALPACTAVAQQPRPVDDAALKNAAQSGDEWLTSGRDYAETHYSPLNQIDASNVKRLGLAWYYDTGSDPGQLEATPIISNGTLYGTLPWSVVFAVDARTGKPKWRWDPQLGHLNFPAGSRGKSDRVRTGPSMCCGPGNRGVAVYDGKVYVGTLDSRLVALDAETGKVVWEVATADKNSDYSVTGQPRIVKGKVIIGNGGGEYALRGYVTAYDAETGKQIWRFYTVPGDPSKPFENKAMKMAAKTWSGEWWKLGGGGMAWHAISYDPQLDLLYIGTGQGAPWVGQLRGPKAGDNLFTCSIIALKPDTGTYVWHFQTTPADVWDYDSIADMVLADIKINGKVRHVLMQAPKNGYFYVIDRKTGKFISAAPLQKITWAKGLDPKTGRPIINPEAYYDTKGTTVWPGAGGGHVWQAMSYNPNTGLVYVTPGAASSFNYVEDANFKYEVGEYNFGIISRRPTAAPGQPAAPPPTSRAGGDLVAMDPATEKERWRVPQMGGGGTMTTAGNLVFAASRDGEFTAISADKGENLWQAKLLQGFANPVTYMLDGKQYVSVLAGRAGKGRLYTFALDGNVPIPPVPTAAPTAGPEPAAAAPAAAPPATTIGEPHQQNQP
jgi:quinohemoprotein ethanol dehydrogenase